MEPKKIKVIQQPNLRLTMETMNVGEYIELEEVQSNTAQQYASMLRLAGKPFKITRVEKKLIVARVEAEEEV